MKEIEKRDKYLDFACELKKLGNIQLTMIVIIVSMLAIILKVLERRLEELEIRGRIETI